MMKKILVLLIIMLLCGCNSTEKKEEIEPDSFEATTTSSKQQAYYINPIADKDGNMVIPLGTDTCIITTDENKANFMKKTFEETIVYYHKLLDPVHEFEGINNIKTINDNYGKGPIQVNEELIELLENAIELSEQTEGYFNPTIGNVSNVWKSLFNNEHINKDPDQETIKDSLTNTINYQELRDYIVIDKDNSTVTFNKLDSASSNVIIDLGAYSKGFVLDKAYEALLKYKDGFLISAGGSSIITYVEPSQSSLHWTIGVKNPNNGMSAFQLKLTTCFISTSGDEQQFFINENGIRRHHILNPYTGYPENNFRSITLIAQKEAGVLDGLTTAIYNLPNDKIVNTIQNIGNDKNINILKALITEDLNGKLVLTYDEAMQSVMQGIDTSQLADVIITK